MAKGGIWQELGTERRVTILVRRRLATRGQDWKKILIGYREWGQEAASGEGEGSGVKVEWAYMTHRSDNWERHQHLDGK